MQKNTKNKAFIYLLLLCLLYVGGQQRVWGQTTEIDRPEPFITVKRVDPRNPAYIYYEFDTNYQLAKPLTLQNLFTEYLYLLPPANPADTFVIVDTLFNDQRTFPKEYKTCTTCISYTYQQYHKGYLVQGADLRVDLKDQLVVKLAGRRVPNLDAEVTNVMSKDAAWDKAWNATLENLLIPRKVKVRNWTQEEVDLFEQTYKCRITKAPNYPIPYFYESYISDKNKHLYHVFDVLWHFSGYRVKIDANTGEIILPKENNQLTEGEPGYSCSESGWVNETIEHDNCNKFATPWDSGLSTQSVEVPVSLYANTESLYGGTCENLNISTYTEDNTLQSYLLMSNKVQLQNASSSENNAYFPVIGWCYEQGNPINKPNLISKGNARNQIIEATAYSSAQKVVNYWSSIGINGYDGAGHCLNVLLYDNTVITKWSQHPMGNYLNLNYVTTGLKASVTLDVVAHEATHGLLLNYFKISNEVVDEAAGLHEGICDIMSVLVRKHANFPELSTTDINATAFPNVASLGEDDANMKWLAYSMIDISHDELPRYIKNPWLSQSVQAAYYNTNAVITGSVTNNYIPSSRYNIAGVITYWFYLLSEGTSPTTPGYLAQTVQGVGMSKAEEVLLAGLKRLFQNDVHDPSFADFAQGVIQACNADPANFPPAVFGAVQDAFCAVNLCSDGSILGSMDIDLNYQITPAGELQACFTPTGLPTQGGRFMMPDDDDLILDPSVWWTVDDGDINTDNISTEEEVCFTLTEDESVNVTLNVLDPETGQIVTISEEAYYNSLWVNGPEDVEISTSPSFTVAFVPPHPANWTYFWTVYEAGDPLSIIENNTATTTPYLTLDEFDLNETTYVVSVMVCDDNTPQTCIYLPMYLEHLFNVWDNPDDVINFSGGDVSVYNNGFFNLDFDDLNLNWCNNIDQRFNLAYVEQQCEHVESIYGNNLFEDWGGFELGIWEAIPLDGVFCGNCNGFDANVNRRSYTALGGSDYCQDANLDVIYLNMGQELAFSMHPNTYLQQFKILKQLPQMQQYQAYSDGLFPDDDNPIVFFRDQQNTFLLPDDHIIGSFQVFSTGTSPELVYASPTTLIMPNGDAQFALTNMAIRRPEGSTPCHDDLEYEVDLRDITLGDLVGNASGLYKVVFTMAYDYYGKGDPTYYTQERYIYLTNNVNTDCNNYVPFVINGITTQSDCDGITFSPNLNITGTSSALSYRYYLNNTVVNTNPTQANFTLPFDSNPPPASFNVTLRVCDHSLNYCEDYTQAITIDPNQVMPFSLQTTLPNGPLSLCASANSSQTYYLPNSFVVLRDGNTFSGSEAAASQNFSYTYTFLTEPPSGFSIEGNELHVAPNTEGNVSIQIDVNNGFDCVHSTYVYVSVYRISTTPIVACAGTEVNPAYYVNYCFGSADAGGYSLTWTCDDLELPYSQLGYVPDNFIMPAAGINATMHLSITHNNSLFAQADIPINALPLPSATIALPNGAVLTNNELVLCQGESITLNATSDNGIYYYWSPPDNLSSRYVANPVVTIPEGLTEELSTTYTVSIADENSCASEASINIKFKPLVSPTFGAINPSPLLSCVGETIDLAGYLSSLTGTDNSQYDITWTYMNNTPVNDPAQVAILPAPISNSYNPNALPLLPPNQNLLGVDALLLHPDGCLATKTVHLWIAPGDCDPIANDDYFTVNYGESIALNVFANDNNLDLANLQICDFSLPESGSLSSMGTGFNYTAEQPGNYLFTYSICNPGGSVSQATVHIEVKTDCQNNFCVTTPAFTPITINFNEYFCGLVLDENQYPSNSVHGGYIYRAGEFSEFPNLFRYTPLAGFLGDDFITLTQTDGNGATATVTIHVFVGDVSEQNCNCNGWAISCPTTPEPQGALPFCLDYITLHPAVNIVHSVAGSNPPIYTHQVFLEDLDGGCGNYLCENYHITDIEVAGNPFSSVLTLISPCAFNYTSNGIDGLVQLSITICSNTNSAECYTIPYFMLMNDNVPINSMYSCNDFLGLLSLLYVHKDNITYSSPCHAGNFGVTDYQAGYSNTPQEITRCPNANEPITIGNCMGANYCYQWYYLPDSEIPSGNNPLIYMTPDNMYSMSCSTNQLCWQQSVSPSTNTYYKMYVFDEGSTIPIASVSYHVTMLPVPAFTLAIDNGVISWNNDMYIYPVFATPPTDNLYYTWNYTTPITLQNHTWLSNETDGGIAAHVLHNTNYTLSIFNQYGCSNQQTITATPEQILVAGHTGIGSHNYCGNDHADGSLLMQIAGGSGNYGFTWSDGYNCTQTGTETNCAARNNLAIGNYMVTITDLETQLQAIDTIAIEPVVPNITEAFTGSLNTSTDTITEGPFSYNVDTISIRGGLGQYFFDWTIIGYVRYDVTYDSIGTGATVVIYYADDAQWNVTISNEAVCDDVLVFSNVALGSLINISNYQTIPSNVGVSNGSITLTVVGGNTLCGQYQYTWTGPSNWTPTYETFNDTSTLYTLSNLPTGWYSVTVTDCLGGFSEGWYWVAESGEYNAVPVATNSGSVCAGDTVVLNVEPYLVSGLSATYQWENSSGYSSVLQNPSIQNVTPLDAGVYTVTVSYSNGYVATASTTVVVHDLPIVSISGPPSFAMCEGETATLIASGGSSYLWSTGSTTATIHAFPTISYTVTVTDNNGCTASANPAIIIIHPKPVINSITPSCVAGVGKITVIATGAGLSYNIGSGSQTSNVFNSLANGDYTVTVTTSYGCTAVATTTIDCVPCPAPIASNNSPLCAGSVINLSVAPNLVGGLTASYAWSGPAGTSTMQNPAISNATTSKAGIYTVTVTYSNGCVATASTNVVVNAKPVVSAATPSCIAGVGKITVTATGTGLSYNIGSGSQTSNVFNSLANGIYTVTVTNDLGCTATANVTLNCTTCPTPIASNNSPLCTGSVINLSVAPNLVSGLTASYAWSGPSGSSTMQNPAISNATPSKAGIYTVTVTYSNGCVATASTNVVVNTKPVVSAATPSCVAGVGTITVTATGTGLTYDIGSGSQTSNVFDNLANGTYTVTVTNSAVCSSTKSATINCSGSVQQNNKQDANLLMIVQPNPFRTETQINFTLPKASLVTLCIYDLQGRLVATLLNNSVEEKGLHQIQFDATNLSNGIYFCQLHTPDVIATQQLVKLKR